MEEYDSEKLVKKKFDKGIFRRWICLLLAIIMVLPAAGGVFAANGEDLVNEAFVAIDKAHKTDIARINSAIWWINEGGQEKIVTSDSRTKAIFLSALLERLLGYENTLIDTPPSKVEVEVLGTKYTISIENSTASSPDFPGDDEAEKLQIQYQIDKLVKEINAAGGVLAQLDGFIKELEPSTSTVTAARLKEIEAKVIGCDKEIQKYDEEVIRLTIQAIGVPGVKFEHLDYALYLLKNKVIEARLKIVQRNEQLEEDAKNASKKMIQDELGKIVTKINEDGGALKTLGVYLGELNGTVTIDRLKEMEAKLVGYKADVKSYGDRVQELKRLAEAPPKVDDIDYSHVDFAIVLLGDKITEVEEKLAPKLINERIKEAELAVTKAEKDKTNADVTAAKKAVAFLEDETDKTDFTDRIEYVEQVIKAIAAVDKAVKSKKAEDYGAADALVNGTGDPKVGGLDEDTGTAPRDVRKGLNGKLAELELIIDADAHKKAVAEASKLITLAEGNLTKYLNGTIDQATMTKSIEDAKTKVDALDAGDDKDNLWRRLVVVNNRYTELNTAMTAVKSAVDIIEMKFIEGKDVTKDDITTMDFGAIAYKAAVDAGKKANAIGKALNTRIVEINKVLDAIEAVKGLNRNTLKSVKTAVAKININFSKVKNALNEIIFDLEDDIANETSEDLLNGAFTAVTTDKDKDSKVVTSVEIANLIKTAKTLIGKETDNIEKIKLTAVINAIDTAQKAKGAVALAGATKLRKDYDKADNLVKSISEDNLGYITGDSKNLIGLKNELNNKLAPLLKIISLAEAKAAVVKAENSLNQKDYDLAFTAIGKVEGNIDDSTTDKYELKKRLDIVKSVIDATNALAKAVSAVGEAGKLSKDLDNSEKIAAAKATITDATNAIAKIGVNGKYKINRETMNATVKDLENIYIVAIDAVKSLSDVQQISNTTDLEYKVALDEAKAAVGKVTDSKVRSDLEAGITAIEARRNAAGTINNAEEKLVTAETMLNNLLLGDDMKFDPDKPIMELEEFEEKIEEIKKAIAEADTEIKKVKDKRATEFKSRLAAVTAAKDVAILIAKAEGKDPLVKTEVDAATKALPKVKEDIIKDGEGKTIINHKEIKAYFEARVNYLNATLVKAQQLAEAKKLTDKAYETLAEGDINKAIDYVSKMQDSTDKNKFNVGDLTATPKINGIKDIVDKLAGTVRDKINDAIPLVAVNDKTAAKAVSDARKSFESFKKIVNEAHKKLVDMQKPEDQVVKYKETYDKIGGHIPHYNKSLGILDKASNIWKLMLAAEKSKKKEDVEAIRTIHLGKDSEKFKDEINNIGKINPENMMVKIEAYDLVTSKLEEKQKELENYQSDEAGRQKAADEAIGKAKDVLNRYAPDKSVTEDVYQKEARKNDVRTNLTIEISSARVAIEGIKDAAVKKTKLAELAKIEVYRDAITAVGNALAYPTQATYKAAEAAVKKCSYDYGLVLAELQSELRDINSILDSYAKAEKATKLVEIAEQTKLQSDVDKARMAVDMLDDINPAKIPLDKRLDKVQEFINTKDGVDKDASNAARDLLGKALINITQASRYFDLTALEDKDIQDAYSLLRGREGKDEDNKPIIEAGAMHFIRDAKSEINKISDILLKETLDRLVIQREEELQNALHEIHIKASERLLGIANEATNKRLALAADRGDMTEKEWTEERLRLEREARKAIEEARNTIDEMFLPGFMTQKDNLMKWLNQIIGDLANENAEDRYIRAEKMIKEASDAVEKAARSREEADKDKFNIDLKAAKDAIFFAQQAIHAIPAGYNKDKVEGLQKVLDGLQMLWQNISDGVSDEKTIAEAKELIEIVKQKLKAWKAGDETEKNVEIAFTIARNKVMGIIDNAKRTELNLELDALEEEFRADGGQVIIPDDGRNKQSDFDRAKAAVLKAVESRLQKDVDAARKLVAKLVDGPSKDAMNRILDGIIIEQTEEEKRKEEEAKRKEEEAKKKAEEARKKKYPGIDDALNSKDRDKNNPDAKWGKENEFKKK